MTNPQAPLAVVTSASTGLTAHSLLSNPSLFETYTKLAKIIVTSQLSYGKVSNNEDATKKERDIFLIMLKGLEIGMLPMQALDSIDVIAGKPAIKPQGMLAQIKSKGLLESMKIEDDGSTCTVTMKRKGETEPYVEAFGMADADKMMTTEWVSGSKQTISLSQKANWKAQPKTMRKWRAIAACCRTAFPDVIQGMYTPEELGADIIVSEDGDMEIIDPPPAPTTGSIPANGKKIAPELGQKHGPIGRETPVEPPATTQPAHESEPWTPPTGTPEQLADSEPVPTTWDADPAIDEKTGLTKAESVVSVIRSQTGDNTLTWEQVKTFVPGEPGAHTGQDFIKLAVAAWQAKQKPAKTRLGQQPTTPAVSPAAPPDPQAPQKQVIQNVICDTVRYIQSGNTRYLEFAKGTLRIRRYDRSGTFRKEVGDGYYNENGFEQMVPMTPGDEPYSINPIQVFYEAKVSEDGTLTYNLATKCVPITDEKALDQYFGEIPFLPEAG